MKRTIKLHTISLSVATTIVLTLWVQLPRLTNLNEVLNNNVLKVFIGLLASTGFYKLAINLIIYLAKKFLIIKKVLLGNSYLNGTWTGFYIGASGNVRFYVERFEQELDNLVIRGHSNKLIGFSSDLHIGVRTKSMEIRISDDNEYKIEDALIKARELYLANKDSF